MVLSNLFNDEIYLENCLNLRHCKNVLNQFQGNKFQQIMSLGNSLQRHKNLTKYGLNIRITNFIKYTIRIENFIL